VPEHFKALPKSVNKQEICVAVQTIIGHLHSHGNKTYLEISQAAAALLVRPPLEAATIKVFLEKKTGKANSNNRALPVLYDYIRSGYQDFPDATKQLALQLWSVLVPEKISESEPMAPGAMSVAVETERLLGVMFKKWLKLSDREVDKLSAKMFGDFSGDYILVRKSVVDPAIFVKSRLRIDRANGQHAVLRVRHFHVDRQNVERVSSGVLLPLVSNIYGILEVENGEGLEFLALRNPVNWAFQKLMGFMISMNMDRSVLCARIFIEREGISWDGIGSRFKEEDVKDRPHILSRLSLVDAEKSRTIPDV